VFSMLVTGVMSLSPTDQRKSQAGSLCDAVLMLCGAITVLCVRSQCAMLLLCWVALRCIT
jgi:hypothetical protein